MTLRTNSRIAGAAYLLYIAVALPSMMLFGRATRGEAIATKLETVAAHSEDVRMAIVLGIISCFCALVLAVTLHAITRDEDRDLALVGFACRVGEGVAGALNAVAATAVLWLATQWPRAPATDPTGVPVLGAFLLKVGDWNTTVSATFFAAGSTAFSYLLLRGRIVPGALAWLGVVASILVLVTLPAQLTGSLSGPILQLMWLPMLVYELVLAVWLIVKGARPARGASTAWKTTSDSL